MYNILISINKTQKAAKYSSAGHRHRQTAIGVRVFPRIPTISQSHLLVYDVYVHSYDTIITVIIILICI